MTIHLPGAFTNERGTDGEMRRRLLGFREEVEAGRWMKGRREAEDGGEESNQRLFSNSERHASMSSLKGVEEINKIKRPTASRQLKY